MKDTGITYGSAADFIFKEALQFLQSKKTILPDEYYKLEKEFKPLAFSIQGYTSLEILDAFRQELEDAITKGITKETFRENMNSFLETKGYGGLNPTRAYTIFLTNIQTAYSVGHYKSMTDDTTMKLRPYWKYVTAGDEDVRESHQAMAGRIYRADDPIWDIWYPPNGFNCRCDVVTLSKRQLEQSDSPLETEIPHDVDYSTGEIFFKYPDKGFSNNPAKTDWKANLSKFPEGLKMVYKEREKKKPKTTKEE